MNFFRAKPEISSANSQLERAVNAAVRSQRLADANISEDKLKDLSRNVDLSVKKINETGDEKDSEGSLVAAFRHRFDDLHYAFDLRSADYCRRSSKKRKRASPKYCFRRQNRLN